MQACTKEESADREGDAGCWIGERRKVLIKDLDAGKHAELGDRTAAVDLCKG
jgi:hypothetical protein